MIHMLQTKSAQAGLEMDVFRFYRSLEEGTVPPTFLEQARLVGQCNILIGMHGAGLTWVKALPPGSFIIMLGHEERKPRLRRVRATEGDYYRNFAAAWGQGFVFAHVLKTEHVVHTYKPTKVHVRNRVAEESKPGHEVDLPSLWAVVRNVTALWTQHHHPGLDPVESQASDQI